MIGLYKTWGELKRQGILGINKRNAEYILPLNKREYYPLVDDKVLTKQLAAKHNVSVPELYYLVEIQRQVRDLPEVLKSKSSFVIKPARGSGGEGVTVIAGRSKNFYRKASGALMSDDELKHHVSMILGGVYSLGGHPDKAIIEYRVQFDPIFEQISYLGVPDVRIIIFMGVPVMSMVRLPTRMSDGKANLHQGAVGAGVDIVKGVTTTAVWRNEIIIEHPDTGYEIPGLQIPGWNNLLELAARSYEMTGLAYQGVDLVLDKQLGPLLLELNARPGLNIQLANRLGLVSRLNIVSKANTKIFSASERVQFACEKF